MPLVYWAGVRQRNERLPGVRRKGHVQPPRYNMWQHNLSSGWGGRGRREYDPVFYITLRQFLLVRVEAEDQTYTGSIGNNFHRMLVIAPRSCIHGYF